MTIDLEGAPMDLVQEILTRLARIETKLDRYDVLEVKVCEAYNKSIGLEVEFRQQKEELSKICEAYSRIVTLEAELRQAKEEIVQLKESRQWNFRTTIGTGAALLIALAAAAIALWGK